MSIEKLLVVRPRRRGQYIVFGLRSKSATISQLRTNRIYICGGLYHIEVSLDNTKRNILDEIKRSNQIAAGNGARNNKQLHATHNNKLKIICIVIELRISNLLQNYTTINVHNKRQ